VLAVNFQFKGEKAIGTNFRDSMFQLYRRQRFLLLAERPRISEITLFTGKCEVLVLNYSPHKEDVSERELWLHRFVSSALNEK
jgi:hypothetical protein